MGTRICLEVRTEGIRSDEGPLFNQEMWVEVETDGESWVDGCIAFRKISNLHPDTPRTSTATTEILLSVP
jgi:hypothetical protein